MPRSALLLAVVFTAGLTLGVFLSQRLKPSEPASTATLDLRLVDGQTVRVRKVVDGDTIVLENGLHLRYSGVNAPESGRFVKNPAPLAQEATERNRALVEGRDVRIELAREPLDMYGRALGRVFIRQPDGATEIEAGEQLVIEGLARAMNLGLDAAVWERLRAAQESAKNAKTGLWGLSSAEQGLAGSATGEYLSSTEGAVFHTLECAQAQRIKAENRRFHLSPAEALAHGLRSCELCKPGQKSKE